MHPSTLYDVAVREHERVIADRARAHQAAPWRSERPRTTTTRVRTFVRRHRARATSAPALPARRPAADPRPAADGHLALS
ncbi:hypothetical protein J4G33_07565 [Actinotalea sp. BY-33]|uniref:Uncharacterized protein n=1 Tax=Actinotalea soli TaxID=2819234 RepID=A0A939RUS4_9CELL|nr:hypothetical protein [Actinotalea soli]MBO1751660.1 hypothetical protein [Actinotalea soli]